MLFLVVTTSLPAVYRPNEDAQTTTAGKPHARAKIMIMMEIVATTSLQVNRLMATNCNAPAYARLAVL